MAIKKFFLSWLVVALASWLVVTHWVSTSKLAGYYRERTHWMRGLTKTEVFILSLFWLAWCGLGLIEWLQGQWQVYRNPKTWKELWAWLTSPHFFTLEEKRAWRQRFGCDWSELNWHSREDFRQHGLAERKSIDWTGIIIPAILTALLILVPLLLRPRPFG